MKIIAVQSVGGGCGSTSIAAGLAWSLHQLGIEVLLVDFCPANDIRLFFNIAVDEGDGWARAILDRKDWREAAWRFVHGLDVLPFGRVDQAELGMLPASAYIDIVQAVRNRDVDGIVILDLVNAADRAATHFPGLKKRLLVARPDMQSFLRASQSTEEGELIVVNQVRASSQLHQASRILFSSLSGIPSPITLHYDEAMAESIACKRPVGLSAPTSLAATELRQLATRLLSQLK